MRYYVAMKMNRLLLHTTIWMNPTNIIWMKEATHYREHSGDFHLCDVQAKPMVIGIRIAISRGAWMA